MEKSNELEKDDKDFDFFKKSKYSDSQLKINEVQKNTSNLKLSKFTTYLNLRDICKKIAIISLPIIAPICIGLILTSYIKKEPVEIKTYNTVTNTVPVQVQTLNEPIIIDLGKTPNIDYSKVSKEDGERIKQALKQFDDITKQLKEIPKLNN